MDVRAEQITGPVCFHGEGLVWWERWGRLRFVDMFAGACQGKSTKEVISTAVGQLKQIYGIS